MPIETITVRINTELDDGTHLSSSTHIYHTAAAFYQVGHEDVAIAQNLSTWATFRNILIPRGASITRAFLTLQGATGFDRSNTIVNSRIDGLASDDSPIVTHAIFDGGTIQGAGHGRATANRTTAQVFWNDIEAVVAGVNYDTPSIQSIIQEIVNRPGWARGHALTIFFGDEDFESTAANEVRRIFDSFTEDSANAPLLTVDFDASVQQAPAAIGPQVHRVPDRVSAY